MRITRSALLFLFAALAVVGLAACDQSEQNYTIEPGNSLSIQGPDEVALPISVPTAPGDSVSYNALPYTINKEYNWTVDGPAPVTKETRRGGEFVDVTFNEPGAYTITLESQGEGDDYTGDLSVDAYYPLVPTQADRFGFSRLLNAVGAAGLADTLGTDGPFTVLAPTNDALVAALDTLDDGSLNLPAPSVLADILSYHVVTDSLPTDEISEGQMELTLEGSDVTFHTNGDITVEDGSPATDDATIINADVPAGNGLIHAIDDVLLPPSAAVAMNDQTSTGGDSVTVRSVYLPEGGFVAIHDSTLLDEPAQVLGSVVGVSEALDAGIHNNVKVELFDVPGQGFPPDSTLAGDQQLIAMPHFDSNDNGVYDFITSGGDDDGPYTEDGDPVIDPAFITVEEAMNGRF